MTVFSVTDRFLVFQSPSDPNKFLLKVESSIVSRHFATDTRSDVIQSTVKLVGSNYERPFCETMTYDQAFFFGGGEEWPRGKNDINYRDIGRA